MKGTLNFVLVMFWFINGYSQTSYSIYRKSCFTDNQGNPVSGLVVETYMRNFMGELYNPQSFVTDDNGCFEDTFTQNGFKGFYSVHCTRFQSCGTLKKDSLLLKQSPVDSAVSNFITCQVITTNLNSPNIPFYGTSIEKNNSIVVFNGFSDVEIFSSNGQGYSVLKNGNTFVFNWPSGLQLIVVKLLKGQKLKSIKITKE